MISLKIGSDVQFYHYQGLGTTANLTDSAGAVKVSYRTDAFGEITGQEGTSENRQVFTGQEHVIGVKLLKKVVAKKIGLVIRVGFSMHNIYVSISTRNICQYIPGRFDYVNASQGRANKGL